MQAFAWAGVLTAVLLPALGGGACAEPPASPPVPGPARLSVEPPPLYIPPDVKGFQAMLLMQDYYARYYAPLGAEQSAGPIRPFHRLRGLFKAGHHDTEQ